MGASCCQAVCVTYAEYRQALDALPYGKRLPGAVCLLDPSDDPSISPLLRITVAELRKRLGIDSAFNPSYYAPPPDEYYTHESW